MEIDLTQYKDGQHLHPPYGNNELLDELDLESSLDAYRANMAFTVQRLGAEALRSDR